MNKNVVNKSMLAAAGILVAASMAFAKFPSLDLGRSPRNAAAVKTSARNKNQKSTPSQPMDALEVVGHIPLAGTPVTHFVCTQHYSSDYLYAERVADITLIDVTRIEQPSVLANVPYAPEGGSEDLRNGVVAAAGTAALVSTERRGIPTPTMLRNLSIMDYSDPQHPKIARQFTGVTAVGRDEKRGLVFIADREGIWVLQQHFGKDPKVDEANSR